MTYEEIHERLMAFGFAYDGLAITRRLSSPPERISEAEAALASAREAIAPIVAKLGRNECLQCPYVTIVKTGPGSIVEVAAVNPLGLPKRFAATPEPDPEPAGVAS